MPLPKVLFLFLLSSSVLAAPSNIIYRENPLGSDSTFNPLSQYLNLAFDTIQNPYYFTQDGYFRNHETLWQRMKNPFKTIDENGGYGEFVSNELFGLRAVPNYTLHLIGGGFDFRWLAEWYEAHGVSHPYLFAFLTSYLANIGNEAIETTAVQVLPTDNVADLLIFDIAGKLLFLNDGVAIFFYDTLKMRGWHLQPMLNLRKLQIENAGCYYIFRPELFGREYRPFFQMGLAQMVGLSKLVTSEDALTAAIGIALTDPLNIKGDFIWGVMWDKNDSLLASLVFNGPSNLAVRANVYPDVLNLFNLKTGFYTSYSKANEFAVGINLVLGAGLGI